MDNMYQEKDKLLQGRCHESRKVGNNTYLQRRGDTCIALKLHDTNVVMYYQDGSVILDTGGWKTVTTKDRINSGLPPGYHVWQEKGIWYLYHGAWHGKHEKWVFQDGITLRNGKVIRHGGSPKQELTLRKQVREYSKAFIAKMRAGEIPAPSGGDCWFCALRNDKGETMGDFGNSDHIRSHLKESYFVPSLLWNALDKMGASIACKGTIAAKWTGDDSPYKCMEGPLWGQAQKMLTRYIYRQLGLAV